MVLAAVLIIGAISYIYKPIYSVTLNGQFIGYSENKSKLQARINEYIEKGNGKNIAFVEINELPEYKLCFLKRNIPTDDDGIFNQVITGGTNFYKYYAIAVSDEEKAYVSTFEEAEQVVNELKEKNSNNKDQITIIEKYETELKEFSNVETCVANLYVKKVVKQTTKSSSYAVAAKGVNTSNQKVNLGISLIRPVSGTVTSRFGARWGRSHKGIDIGAPKGTNIKAAATGTVTTVQTGCTHNYYGNCGCGGGYGNYVIVSHGNGVQTLYGHCTSILVKKGQSVSQGQTIATVGSTGQSYGNHLHLEIRVGGIAQNPQNYLY